MQIKRLAFVLGFEFLAITACFMAILSVQAARPAAPLMLQVLIGYGEEQQVRETLEPQFRRFEESHPGVKVQLTFSGGGWINQKLQTLTAAGQPPDLVFLWSFQFAEFARAGFFLPLDQELDPAYLARFFPDFVKYGRFEGRLYGLPITGGPASIMYHPDQFDAAGVAPPSAADGWDDFVRKAQALTVDRNGDGEPEQWGFVWYEVVIRDWMTWIWRNGGDLFSADERRFLLNETPAVEAIQWLADLSNRHRVTPPEPVLWVTPWTLFNQGKAAMYAEGAWSLDGLREQRLPQDAAPFPRRKTEAVALEAYYLAVHRNSAHAKEAVALAAFLAGDPECQRAMNRWGWGIPSVAQVAYDTLRQEKARWNIQVFLEPLAKGVTRMMPYPLNWGPVQETIRNAYRKVFDGTTPPRQAAEAIKPKIESLIRQG
ncbi:MAG TPA: sugar ABC transporter substrate-binding protein [Firmicutes bacterium]|nr:sugar ABC transporter substrate-binding protein [Bacillota bacterium]